MLPSIANKIVESCSGYFNEDPSIREKYSGRGMFERETCGLIFSSLNDAFLAFALFGRYASSDDVDDLSCQGLKWDNMGMNIIIY